MKIKFKISCVFLLVVLSILIFSSFSNRNKLESLWNNINDSHKAINAPLVPRDILNQRSFPFSENDRKWFIQGGPETYPDYISKEDAKKEMEWFLRLLKSNYGNYWNEGGDYAFNQAKNEVLKNFPHQLPFQKYNERVSNAFSFVKDLHFYVGGIIRTKYSYPLLGNINYPFYRRLNNYYSDISLKNRVISIDGKLPEDILKLSIDRKGKLAYFIYKTSNDNSEAQLIKIKTQKGDFTLPLSAQEDTLSGDTLSAPLIIDEIQGIPYVKLNIFDAPNTASARTFIESAEKFRQEPFLIYDMTNNSGGMFETVDNWFENFTGQQLEPNHSSVRQVNTIHLFNVKAQLNILTYLQKHNVQLINGYYVLEPGKQFVSVKDSPCLFVLMGKASYSAAEDFIDACRNIENVLLIGSNSGGCLTSDAAFSQLRLPISGLPYSFGAVYNIWNENDFSERVGLEPDIYLTGLDCKKRFTLFLENYII